jgi:hypothetical protein
MLVPSKPERAKLVRGCLGCDLQKKIVASVAIRILHHPHGFHISYPGIGRELFHVSNMFDVNADGKAVSPVDRKLHIRVPPCLEHELGDRECEKSVWGGLKAPVGIAS